MSCTRHSTFNGICDECVADNFRNSQRNLRPKDVLRVEPSAKQKVLAVHPKAEMMHVPQPMDGDRVRVYIPLSGWHMSDIWTGSGERAAWEDAASKLSPVPPSPAAIAAHEANILDRAMMIVRSYFHDAKPELREDGRWTMNVIPSTSLTHMMWSETERDLWIDFAISLSKPKPAPSEGLIKEAEETMTMEEKLRGLVAACYMMCGVLVHDGAPIPTKWLDVLSAAANGLPFSDEGLLPFEGWPMLRAGGRSDCGPNESPKSLPPVEATGSETATRIAELEEELKAVISLRDTAVAQLEWWAKKAEGKL